jgi:hypothetical protein
MPAEFAFTAHSYPDEPERWLQAPVGKYLEILRQIMTPTRHVQQIDLCCGLGFGKTLLGIQAAVLLLDNVKGAKILFLEPDVDRVSDVFLDEWYEHVPPTHYTIDKGRRIIRWHNGNVLHYRARVITGSREQRISKRRGIKYSHVIDDETALQFDIEQYQNTIARIRAHCSHKAYITLTTPQVGPYGRFLKRGGNLIFKGRTRDNHYLLAQQPDYESNLRGLMSAEQARRELDGELVALEGRIWKTAVYDPDPSNTDCAWPNGNRHDKWTSFQEGKPWWLFCDIGRATGAFVVVQQAEARHRGRLLFDEPVWVAVADLCPHKDANAMRAFQRLKDEYGRPQMVTGGEDINTGASTDGNTVAYFAQNTWGANIPIMPVNERQVAKSIQYDRMNFLMCSANQERRFAIARDFVSLDIESKRGVREMVDEDAWPPEDKRRQSDFLPKGKDNVVQHTRDALLMGATAVMSPPEWLHDANPSA